MERVLLRDGRMSVALLSHGAVTQGWWLDDLPLILGYEEPGDYVSDRHFLGAIVGRVANRIGGARFELDGQEVLLPANEDGNLLHGGARGLWNRPWRIRQVSPNEARLTLHSPDGDGGFPGAVDFALRVRLDAPCLTYEITARPDRPTPISVAQHNYYCLGDPVGIGTHRLRVAADRVLSLDAEKVPDGGIEEVAGGPLDFTVPGPPGSAGIDHFYVFDPDRDPDVPVADLRAPSGLTLRVRSDQPGAQVYAGQGLDGHFRPRAGLCIEPSGYPNAVNRPSFPSVIATPDRPYAQVLRLEIAEGGT
ncbi:MAG: aldose epimerase family protein [Pseudooceanicola sp.]